MICPQLHPYGEGFVIGCSVMEGEGEEGKEAGGCYSVAATL
jgi:hypothetical protein